MATLIDDNAEDGQKDMREGGRKFLVYYWMISGKQLKHIQQGDDLDASKLWNMIYHALKSSGIRLSACIVAYEIKDV